MKKISSLFFSLGLFLMPAVAFAVTDNSILGTKARVLIDAASKIITLLIGAAFSLAIVYFFYGLARYILHSDAEDAKERGKQIMLSGVIGMFVLISFYGIVQAIDQTLGIDPQYQNAYDTTVDTLKPDDPLFKSQ